MDVTLEPGEGHDFHRHPGQEEMIIVKQGASRSTSSATRRTLGAGDSVYIDEGVVHASFNDGDETAHLQVVIGPSLGDGGYGLVDVSGEEPWASLRAASGARRRRARCGGAARPRIDASTSSIGWNAGSGRPARRSAAVTWTRQPGFPLAYASGLGREHVRALRSPSSRRVCGWTML